MTAPTLWIVGTPLGNLEDITLRALNQLQTIPLIIAEDTRRTLKLINHYSLGKKEMISLPQSKMKSKIPYVIQRLLIHGKGAYVTDAGMPGIGDPVSDLVVACREARIHIDLLPGPSAPVSAFAVSGFRGSFLIEGFLPRDKKRRRFFRSVQTEQRNIVFFESPYRVQAALQDAYSILGNRRVCIAREMTKKHQEFFWGDLEEAIAYFNQPQGEFTLVMEGAKPNEPL